MKLNQIAESLEMEVFSSANQLDVDVTHGYASDLLSDVIANADDGYVWVTLQCHQNIVAVAVMKSLSAIMLVHNRQPDPETLEKAEEEDIVILGTSLTAFDLVARLSEMGLSGS